MRPPVPSPDREPTTGAGLAALSKDLEGFRVSIALVDGTRIDDCELVSAGRPGATSLWLYTNGADTFVALADVAALWEVPFPARPPSQRSPV
jgi:hypothetical protein